MKLTNLVISQLLAIANGVALAEIREGGLWTDNDWCHNDDPQGICIVNGVPQSKDADEHRRINAPQLLDGDLDDYAEKTNVQLVQSILSEEQFKYLFHFRNEVYTYEGFLKAVGKFPYFCNDHGDNDSTDMCKKELATMFAHFVQETSMNSVWDANNGDKIDLYRQGLYYIERIGCEGGAGGDECDFYNRAWGNDVTWPIDEEEQYYPRGPFQLAYNYNYGRFSSAFYSDVYGGKSILLENPDQVHEDGFTVFSAAMWFYMTPQSPKPSMHDIATGHFVPNAVDSAQGIKGGFGSTINIINAWECNKVNAAAAKRVGYYQDFLKYFDITDTENLDCESENVFVAGGAYSVLPSYFTTEWSWGVAKCQLVTWQTEYSVYAKDDYKRCVCDTDGNGEADCPQA